MRRRGRPAQPRVEVDKGTPELRRHRQQHATVEPLDRLLQQGLLTVPQHQCALRLRWLYTLRYGAPTLQSLSTQFALHVPRVLDEMERSERKRVAQQT